MDFVTALVRRRRYRWARELVLLFGVDIPATVSIGADFTVHHRGFGTVIAADAEIGDRVTIYHGVTVGRSDVYLPEAERRSVRRIVIEDDVVLCAGAVVVAGEDELRIARGTVIGANAVVSRSTRPGEIWAGNPARMVGHRDAPRLRGVTADSA